VLKEDKVLKEPKEVQVQEEIKVILEHKGLKVE
jgi:hypothetical protein